MRARHAFAHHTFARRATPIGDRFAFYAIGAALGIVLNILAQALAGVPA
jgi:hypothetical protein